MFEYILKHFEDLETRAKNGEFGDNPRIQSSITLAWNKATEYYGKTDFSIAWMASLILHPRWKFIHFEQKWTGNLRQYVTKGKKDIRTLWEAQYKAEPVIRVEQSPEPPVQGSNDDTWFEDVLNQMAPTNSRPARASTRVDQLAQYLAEPCIDSIGVLEYWRSKEREWPQLAQMAYDFLAVPAMSSECERVFSSCSKQTTPESSRLSGALLWHQECLKNWQNRGAICMAGAFNAVVF